MRVFFDCEFTSHEAAEQQLISAGFVSEDGYQSLYLELSDWTPDACSAFTQEIVLPRLSLPEELRVPAYEFAAQLVAWLDQFNEPVTLASDYPVDWWLIDDALKTYTELGGKPLSHALTPLIVSTNTRAGESAAQQYWAAHPGQRHHALSDAHCLRQAALCAEDEIAARWRELDG